MTAKEGNARRMHRQCFEQIMQFEARTDLRRKGERNKEITGNSIADLDNVIIH